MSRFASLFLLAILLLSVSCASSSGRLSNQARTYLNNAEEHLKNGRYDEAIEDFNWVIHLSPRNYYAYYKRGFVYTRKKEYDTAIQDFSEAIRLKRDYAWSYFNRSFAYLKKGETNLALRDLNTAIRMSPDLPDFSSAYGSRGHIYYEKGEHAKAIKDFTQSIRLRPTDYRSYYWRAMSYTQIGERKKADIDFSTADRLKAKELGTSSNGEPARSGNTPRNQSIHDIPIFAFYSTSGIFKVYKLGEVIEQKRVNDHNDGSLRFMNLGNGNGKVLGNAGTGFVKVTQTKNSISFIESVPAGGTEHVFTVYDEWDSSVNGYKAVYHRTVNHILANEILKTNYSGYARRAE